MFTFKVGRKGKSDGSKKGAVLRPIKENKPPKKDSGIKAVVIPPNIYTFFLRNFSTYQEVLFLGYAKEEENRMRIEYVRIAAEGDMSFVEADEDEVNECILAALDEGYPCINVHTHTQPAGTYPSFTDWDCYYEWIRTSPNGSKWLFIVFANGFVRCFVYGKDEDGTIWHDDSVKAYIEGAEHELPQSPKLVQRTYYHIPNNNVHPSPPKDPFERILHEIRIGTHRPASDIDILADVAAQCIHLSNQDELGYQSMVNSLFDAVADWEDVTKKQADGAISTISSLWSLEPCDSVSPIVEQYFHGQIDIYTLLSKIKYGGTG